MDDEERRGEERRDYLKLILKSATGDPLGFIVLPVLSDCGPGNDYPTFTTSEHQNGSLEIISQDLSQCFWKSGERKVVRVVLGCCGHFILI